MTWTCKRTTGAQDTMMSDADKLSGISDGLLETIRDLDERLDRAIKRLEQHEINADDI